MLCETYRKGDTLPARYCTEPKLDGIRVLIRANAKFGSVTFETRNGRRLPSLAHLAPQVLAFIGNLNGDVVLDAEATCTDGTFYDYVGTLRASKTAPAALLTVFDLIDLLLPCSARREVLEAQCKATESIRLIERTTGNPDVKAAYLAARLAGYEGIIIKDLDSSYDAGERSSAWLKVKGNETHDCKVVGFDECRTAEGILGALIVDFHGVEVRVGTGFKGREAATLWKDRASLVGSMVEVACQEVTPSGSMRHPKFVRVRGDK